MRKKKKPIESSWEKNHYHKYKIFVPLTTDEITSVEPPKINHLYVSDTGKKN